MFRRRKILTAAAGAIAATILVSTPLLAADATTEQAAASALETIKKRKTIRVGFSTFVPWAMRNSKGDFIGFEVDVAKKLAADNGWEVEHIPTSWDGIIPALIAGKFDVIIGGMSATPKRSQTVNFTIPYAYSTISMSANKKLAGGFSSFDDFNKPNVTIAVRRGSSNVEWMKKHFPNAEYTYFDSDPLAFQEVLNGNAHGVVSAEPKPSLYTLANSDTLFKPFGDDKYNFYPGGFAIRKGDPDFLTFLNTWIQLYMANGWLAERRAYWFETDGWFGEIDKNPFAIK
jgi:polar amino acid transport system substrate-binding protein